MFEIIINTANEKVYTYNYNENKKTYILDENEEILVYQNSKNFTLFNFNLITEVRVIKKE